NITGAVSLARRIDNFGTTTWSGTGNISTSGGGSSVVFDNKAGGQFLIQNDQIIQGDGGGAEVVINAGLLRKTVASGTTTVTGVVDFNNTTSGVVEVQTGTLQIDGFSGGTNSGVIDLAAAATLGTNGSALLNAAGGIIRGNGMLNLAAATLSNDGLIAPGAASGTTIGTLSITGNLANNAGGTIEAGLGGATAGTGHDQIIVSGSATLGGTLNAPLVNGFTPSNQSVDILSAGSASGSFATSNLPSGVNGAIVGNLYRLTHTGVICGGICWDGGGGNSNWSIAANWTGDALPGSADVAYLNLVAGVTVNLADSQTIKGLNSTANNHLTIAAGGALTLIDPGTTSTLAGNLTISGGTLTANGPMSLANLTQSSGTLSGAGAVSAGIFNWTGGTLTGTGAINVNSALSMPAGVTPNAWNYTFLDGKPLTNNGTATLGSNQDQGGNGADLRLLNGAAIFNAGTWDINYANINSTGVNSFNNSGTLNVGALGNGGTINAAIDSSGALNVLNNGLNLFGGGSVTGDLSVSGGTLAGTIDLAPANFSLGTGAAVATTGSLAVTNSFSDAGGSFSGTFSSIDITQSSGALTVPALTTANAITLSAPTGTVTLNGVQTTTAANSSIVIEGSGFANAVGAGAFSVGAGGRWLVYASDPGSVTKNGLTSDFRRYSNSPGALSATGNGFIYTSAAGTLSVDVTLTGSASHVYGDAPTASFGYTLTGFADAEDNAANIGIAGAPGYSMPLPTSASDAGNYNIAYDNGLSSDVGYSFSGGTGVLYDVTQAPLAITASDQSKVYGDTLGFAGTEFTVLGLKNGQTVDSVTLASSGADSLAGVAGSPYAITAGAATGGSFNPANYSVTYADGALAVTPRPLTVSFVPATKTYDGNVTATVGGYTLNNLANGDLPGVVATAAYDSRNVGAAKTVSYSGLALTGAKTSDYSLPAATTGSGSITPLASVAWTGGASGNWSAAANWAGAALPDGSNVLAVSIPVGTTVTFDAVTVPTQLASLAIGSGGSFVMAGSSLGIAGSLTTPVYNQSGGMLNGTGTLNVSESFAKSGGSLALSGPLNITQAAGGLTIINDAPLTLGAVSTISGNILVDASGGIFTTASPVSANGGSLAFTAHSPIHVGSGGLAATSDLSLSAPTPSANSTITLDGPLSAGGAVNVSAYGAIAQNAGIQGQSITLLSASGNIVLAADAVSSVPAGGSIGYSASAGSITSSPTNFAGATPSLVSSAGTFADTGETATRDIVTTLTRTTEALADDPVVTETVLPPTTPETSADSVMLSALSQTTGGDAGTFGASAEPEVGAGGTATSPAPTGEAAAPESTPAKSESASEAGKDKDEKKDEAKDEKKKRKDDQKPEKKDERRAAAKKVAQCT
ncbi:MAG: YDG domain-containing protein, partial [Pseudomonadota bacterium]